MKMKMKWTEEELSTFGILKRINDRADQLAEEQIIKREGYQLPASVFDWNSKQSKDYRHYFNVIKQNIIDNEYPKMNKSIRKEYREHLEEKERHIKEMKEWEKYLQTAL